MSSAPALNEPVVTSSHIRLDAQGVAWIEDTRVKVIEIVLNKHAHGWSAEEIHFQHPNLSLAQIYAALAWYYDHQALIDDEIARRGAEVESITHQTADSPLRVRLRGLGLLS